MLELFPRSPSYPLAEGLRRFGDAELAAWLDQNANSDDQQVQVLYWERMRELERSILPDIRRGVLIASAFQEPISITSTRQRISPDIWAVLELNVQRGRDRSAGFLS